MSALAVRSRRDQTTARAQAEGYAEDYGLPLEIVRIAADRVDSIRLELADRIKNWVVKNNPPQSVADYIAGEIPSEDETAEEYCFRRVADHNRDARNRLSAKYDEFSHQGDGYSKVD